MYRFMRLLIAAVFFGIAIPMILSSVAVRWKQTTNSKQVEKTEQPQMQVTIQQVQETYIPVMTELGAVEEMSLETYLTGVVLCEMPASFHLEALKAQAIVARTYTLRNHLGSKHGIAAVCTSASCCQGYCSPESYIQQGGTEEMVKKIADAVAATKDLVLTYEDALIEATYFSCSGGKTEAAVAVWGSDIPYLQSVDSPGEESADHYIDTAIFPYDEFVSLFGVERASKFDECITDITYTDGGGVETIKIYGVTYKGTEIRQRLGLKSTAFVITPVEQGFLITTKGFGHRVGMSQYGANAMATAGSSCAQILEHYFPGTELTKYP